MMTIRTCLDNQPRKSGLCKVMFRFTKSVNNTVKMKHSSTYISVLPSQWNKNYKGIDGGGVRNTHPMAFVYNEYLLATFYKMQNWAKDNPDATAEDAKAFFDNKDTKEQKEAKKLHNFKELALLEIEKPKKSKKGKNQKPAVSTKKSLTSIVEKFVNYFGEDLALENINCEKLNKYGDYLLTINKESTANTNLSKIVRILKDCAILMPADWQPWVGVNYFNEPRVLKGFLSEIEIEKIENWQPEIPSLQNDARNAFLLQFYIAGERISDVLAMTWQSITDERFQHCSDLNSIGLRHTFKMYKSEEKKIHSSILPPEAIEILKYYQKTRGEKKFVLPFFDAIDFEVFGQQTEAQRKKLDAVKGSKTALINNNLKKMCIDLGIKKISTHTARHSFAQMAKKYNGNLLHIKDTLGHSNMSTTEDYFDTQNFDASDSVQSSVHDNLRKIKENTNKKST